MSSNGVNTAAFMHSFYQTRDDMSKPAPSSPIDCGTNNTQACNNYYTYGLRRQYTTPADFVDFAAQRGVINLHCSIVPVSTFQNVAELVWQVEASLLKHQDIIWSVFLQEAPMQVCLCPLSLHVRCCNRIFFKMARSCCSTKSRDHQTSDYARHHLKSKFMASLGKCPIAFRTKLQ